MIGHRSLPRLGANFDITYSGPHAIEPGLGLTEQPLLVIGATRIDLPIPPLLVTQPPRCTLYPSPDVVVPTGPDPSGRAFVTTVSIPIPNVASMSGSVVYLQWATTRIQYMFVGCGPLWVVFSDAGRAVIGT
ncbi:MAG: hypothetical protein IPM29_24510 [Planctomycetes bacterium]|nr:hypothetical protein [Planctomycetota bacterium]